MESLKEQFFNTDFYNKITLKLKSTYPQLAEEQFLIQIQLGMQSRELMERLEHCSETLHHFLPSDYLQALEIIEALAPEFGDFTGMIFPNFVQRFGLDYYEDSIRALHYLTRFSSSEFAIRVFLKQNFEATLKEMIKWAGDENNHVRRLASEGTRARLPWSFKLDEVVKNPRLTQPIIDQLKEEKDLYVKKSVGNHINDWSKDHPEFVLDYLSKWDQNNKDTQWMLKKGIRSLVKDGHPATFPLLGFTAQPTIKIEIPTINTSLIKLGQDLEFNFMIQSLSDANQLINIDYMIFYMKKNGQKQPKVFKLKELSIKAGEEVVISKKHAFKDFSTRKHYEGEHALALLINGIQEQSVAFELVFN